MRGGMPAQPDAPRFRAYLERAEGRAVLHMGREDWIAVRGQNTDAALIDITRTPLASLAKDATLVASYVLRLSPVTSEVRIVRLDPPDAPDLYNVDKYAIWEDLPSHPCFESIIRAASTEDNANLREYLKRTVFLVKREPDVEHHQSEIPAVVRVLLRGQSA